MAKFREGVPFLTATVAEDKAFAGKASTWLDQKNTSFPDNCNTRVFEVNWDGASLEESTRSTKADR